MDKQNFDDWDPLEAAAGTDQEVITAAKKREIRNILKSYVGTYDSISELLQNAMDAVERQQKKEPENSQFNPYLKIYINLKENSFKIEDNGCGFNKSEFEAFLAPNISYKRDKGSRGNKGVGITYIAYGFNKLEVRTKNQDFTFQGEFSKGRDWVEDNSGTVTRPHIKTITTEDEDFNDIQHGTSFKLIFGGNKTRPSDLSWYKATTATQWLYLLLIKTPLGHIDLPNFSESKIHFDLNVIDKQGHNTSLTNEPAKYKYPHLEINASQQLKKINEVQRKAIDKGRDPSLAIEKYKKSNGIYDSYTQEDINRVMSLDEDEKKLITKYSITAYGYFAYSLSIWDQLNDNKAKLRKGYRVLQGGLQLANNHMVQGDLILIPLTKNIGHQKQAHVILHFSNADPDLGRKGFQPELKKLAEKISIFIVQQLSNRRDILKGDSGAKPNIAKELALHEWIQKHETHEKEHPLILTNEHFFLPTKKISIQSEPVSEQDVIVLFNQLIAGGVVRGIQLLATSQIDQYDGIFKFNCAKPFENHIFCSNKNPLGVHQEQLTQEFTGPPQVLEYKFSLDGLIREFENEVKNERDIELAVFWDIGEEYKREYTVTSYLDFENIHKRGYHGITHEFRSANSNFLGICLKELIDLLNNPTGQQAFQAKEYGDDI